MPHTLFIVDDEESIRKGIVLALGADYTVRAFSSGEELLERMKKGELPDLILMDIGLPKISGIEALREVRRLYADVLVIMITAFEDPKSIISAMKLGAYDYVIKPLVIDALEINIRNALETVRLRKEVHRLQKRLIEERLPSFIGESRAIRSVMELVEKVAKSEDTPVLIIGETGTGKEIVAAAIHYKSPNFNGPFITVNSAAIPGELLESELFGYEKGAFSGARASGKKGLVEQASNGTLFLDEVADLSREGQAKLLRFLESGEYYRVGGTKKLHVKTRVVSATNRNLEKMIDSGLFREDLFFRLGVIKVELPSLRERREDILPIAKHFLLEMNKKYSKFFEGLSPDAEQYLENNPWKGNVRELRSVIERGVLLGEGPRIVRKDLESGGAKKAKSLIRAENDKGAGLAPLSADGLDLPAAHDSLDRHYFLQALKMSGGNDTKAAQLLRMNYYSFRYRKRQLELEQTWDPLLCEENWAKKIGKIDK